MAPEYGATCEFFSTDKETINYLKLSGKDDHQINIVNILNYSIFGQKVIMSLILMKLCI